jgi:hypothetical protein
MLVDPATANMGTITATTETVLIPTIFTPIPAMEPRAGKVYKLTVGWNLHHGPCWNADHHAATWNDHQRHRADCLWCAELRPSITLGPVPVRVLSSLQDRWRCCRRELDLYLHRAMVLRWCCGDGIERNDGCAHQHR